MYVWNRNLREGFSVFSTVMEVCICWEYLGSCRFIKHSHEKYFKILFSLISVFSVINVLGICLLGVVLGVII